MSTTENGTEAREVLPGSCSARPTLLSVYLVGNLRTFLWTAPQALETMLRSLRESSSGEAEETPAFYVFMHTWDLLESPDQAWWKVAESSSHPAEYVHGILSSPATNPFLTACHPSIGQCFVHVVEHYAPEAIPVPEGYNRKVFAQRPSNRTHRYWRLWSLYVQLYTWRRVHELAKGFFSEHLGRPRCAGDVILKLRPDVDLRALPPLRRIGSALALWPSKLYGAAHRGGVSDVAFVTSVLVLDRLLLSDALQSEVVETLRPEHLFKSSLRRLGVVRALGGFHFELCRLQLGNGRLAVTVGSHQYALGECLRKG